MNAAVDATLDATLDAAVNALVLAAGAASRFGVPKVLLPAGGGETLLSRVLGLALETARGQVVVVLGREAALAGAEVERWLGAKSAAWGERLRSVVNPNYARGLGLSLRTGILVLEPSEPVLVLLADQPALTRERLEGLVVAYRQGGALAAAPTALGEQRPPVVLGPELLPELLVPSREVGGDVGARKLLARHAARVRWLEWGEGLWSADVDSWESYRELAWALAWQDDPAPSLPVVHELPPGLLEAARRALDEAPAPYLAPEVLVVRHPVPAALYSLSAGALPGLRAVAAGGAESARGYLCLLRRAALTLVRLEG